MTFQLKDSGWHKLLAEALEADCSQVRILSPFIKEKAAKRLLEFGRPASLEIITRFNLDNFREGVSDISALRLLLKSGAIIRGIKNLHAKGYLIGHDRVIITSANLTEQGLTRNHELGFFAQDPLIVESCHSYFEKLWKQAGKNLLSSRLNAWDKRINDAKVFSRGGPATPSLGDEGADVGIPKDADEFEEVNADSHQGFVKFFGLGGQRIERSTLVLDEVKGSECHWACSYPKGKRPRQVRDGDLIFPARMVRDPDDIIIYGRATGFRHVPDRDDANKDEIRTTGWKKDWPHYIRVRDAVFVAGTLAEGISLNKMMEALGHDAFMPTQRNALEGKGNVNPRKSYMRKAAIMLTPRSLKWIEKRLGEAFQKHGRIEANTTKGLKWPKSHQEGHPSPH